MRQPEIEAMDRGELELLQLERLQSTLTRAYRQVKFYRRQFDQLGLNLDDIKSLKDLARLPCTTRDDLSENYPYGLFAVPLRDIVRILSSPGTTEKPLVVGYAPPDLKLWLELLARMYVAAGVTREDILQIILPPGLANWRRDLQAGAEYLGASVIPPAILNFAKELMVMRDYKTSVLVTTPSVARHLLTVMARMDLSPAELSLKCALLVASPLPEAVRREIEAGFQVKCATAYGITEVMGPGLAFSCGADGGLHFSEDHFYPEIIDPETGDPVPPGTPGELVITTLSTMAFPLVRFRSGDRTSLTPGNLRLRPHPGSPGENHRAHRPHLFRGGHQGPPGPGGRHDPGSPGRTPAQIQSPGGLGRGPGNPGHRTDGGGGVFLGRDQGLGMPVPPGPPPSGGPPGHQRPHHLKGTWHRRPGNVRET